MILVTLTGPSGSGKTTILNKLIETGKFTNMISHTTRSPRPNEKEGVDYFYVSDEQFLALKDEGKFIESVEFNGFRYGISIDQLHKAQEDGKTAVLIVEPKGLKQVADYLSKAGIPKLSFFVNGSAVDMVNRYMNRINLDDFKNQTLAENHARRLISIAEECNTWRRQCFCQIDFEKSTPETLAADVESIMSSVRFLEDLETADELVNTEYRKLFEETYIGQS